MSDENTGQWLIVGLGNPGDRYDRTWHNLGFMLIDRLAGIANVSVGRLECRAMIGRAEIDGRIAELVKPQTYMNLSGESVACLLKKDERDLRRLIVISDDIALPVGKIRIRPKGSAGGHNGLKSINECLKTQDYIRLRLGIGPEHLVSDTKRFVLEKIAKPALEVVEKVLDVSADAVQTVITDGVEAAMAKYN